MQQTDKPLTLAWLIAFGLVTLSGSAMVLSSRVLLLVGAALVIPALTYTFYSRLLCTIGAIATTRERAREVLVVRANSEFNSPDVYRWEDEGGAPRTALVGQK